ncbi:1-acyl-sn-glycerol-3-phosphate acyltransferase [uncultured Streptomyces sp.]|uniref:lysophospholipid acyltransferase family protein n=1 Tax=uncultured Streptomyces sp. TaxID=174707 RepID=UPI00262819A6|nr:lysophospholipid acyltransferase family protein [uncultured Streptomyces sp.]
MSVWLPVAPCTPRACAGHRGPVRSPAAAAALLAAGCLLALLGAVCVPAALLLAPAARDRLVRLWARAVVRSFGVRIRVTGAPGPRTGGELVVANHVSWLDVPLVAAVLPGRMLGKAEIRRWPLLGPLAALGGTLFIERNRLRALPEAVATVAGALRSGGRVVAFPEGSTWCGRDPGGVFRPAVFQAALDAGATVRPVRIRYVLPADGGDRGTATAVAFVGDDPLGASLWRVVRAGGVTAEITLAAPVPAAAAPDRRALARLARSAVLGEAVEPARSGPADHAPAQRADDARAHPTGYGTVPGVPPQRRRGDRSRRPTGAGAGRRAG